MSRITTQFPYGQHIALFCIHHPEKRWSTKNISHIGARNIFYDVLDASNMGRECDCPARDLRPVSYPDMPAFVEE